MAGTAADPGAAEDREAAEDHQVAAHPVVEAVAAMVVQEVQPLVEAVLTEEE
jgi:hypothetical protein